MRKCYIVIGTWNGESYKYIAGVFTSYKKALWFTKKFSEGRTYTIKTEILI